MDGVRLPGEHQIPGLIANWIIEGYTVAVMDINWLLLVGKAYFPLGNEDLARIINSVCYTGRMLHIKSFRIDGLLSPSINSIALVTELLPIVSINNKHHAL